MGSMGSANRHQGVFVPLVTPLNADGSVALDCLEQLAVRYLDAGVAGLVVLGTTGEPATLLGEEKAKVVETVGRVCADRKARMLVGVGTNSTAATVADAKALSGAEGVTGILSVVPYYTRPSEAGLVEHFSQVASVSPVPVVIYNIPYRTGTRLSCDALLRLAQVENIVGVKQSVGGLDADTLQLVANVPDDFSVLSGEDAFIYPLMTLGGAGTIAAASHVCTEAFVDMVNSCLAGDFARGRAIHEMLLPLCEVLFAEPNPAVTKAVLHAQGLIPSPVLRLPMTAASSAVVARAVEVADEVAKFHAQL